MVVCSHKKLLLSGVLVALLTSGCGWIHWRSSEPARDRSSIDSAGADVTFANEEKKVRAEAAAAAASAAAASGTQADAGAATTTPMPAADSDQNSGTGGATGRSGKDAGGAQVSPMKDPPDGSADQMQEGATTEKVTLQGDALFQFGKADEKGMLPGGKQRLDELADKIMAMEKDSITGITIVGHADRLGSPSGNLKISEKRAATVKDYLVRRGVDAAILQSVGKGDADPITDCPGGKTNKALIACLSSNRRVEVIINSK